MTEITDVQQQRTTRRFKQLYSTYQQQRDLISVGAYARGSDARTDEAIEYFPRLLNFLQQDMHQPVSLAASVGELARLVPVAAGV